MVKKMPQVYSENQVSFPLCCGLQDPCSGTLLSLRSVSLWRHTDFTQACAHTHTLHPTHCTHRFHLAFFTYQYVLFHHRTYKLARWLFVYSFVCLKNRC